MPFILTFKKTGSDKNPGPPDTNGVLADSAKSTPREDNKENKEEKEVKEPEAVPNIRQVKLTWGGSVYLEVSMA